MNHAVWRLAYTAVVGWATQHTAFSPLPTISKPDHDLFTNLA